MTKLLENAIARVRMLPPETQDFIAARLLAELGATTPVQPADPAALSTEELLQRIDALRESISTPYLKLEELETARAAGRS